MGIKIINDNGNSLSFTLSESDVTQANALRRTILSEVPTLAIETVELYNNTSSLYDEVLAHRLGLIPVKTDIDLLNFREGCKCEDGCPSCQVVLTLKKKGPGVVYSDDLKAPQKEFKPATGIPIIKLGNNQEVELSGTAILGKGMDHAKWQPAVVGYKYHPIVDTSLCNDCEECSKVCPVNILTYSKGKIKVTDEKKCILCMACVEKCGEDKISVRGDENRFIFELESTGSLEPRKIFTQACEILMKKAEELGNRL